MKTPIIVLLVASLSAPALAQSSASTQSGDSTHGRGTAHDADMFACTRHMTDVAVTFKSETELKDLITWGMGFTCKNFILDPRIVSTGKKVRIVAPKRLSNNDAYRLFVEALALMDLTLVPKGSVYRIVDARPAQPMVMPALVNGSTRPQQQVPTLEFEVVKR